MLRLTMRRAQNMMKAISTSRARQSGSVVSGFAERLRSAGCCVLLVAVTSCAFVAFRGSGFNVPKADRERLTAELVGHDFALGCSLNTWDFFGRADRLFADPRPPEIVELYQTDGKLVTVPPQVGAIVPAGTLVRVTEVVFPADRLATAVDSRGAGDLAPTAHTWIVLQQNRPGGEARPLVLALPMDIPDAEAFRAAVRARLRDAKWVMQWLTQRTPEVFDGILHKEAVRGMSRSELVAAVGEPKNAPQLARQAAPDLLADYGDLQVRLRGDLVVMVASKKAQADEAMRVAMEEADKRKAEAEIHRIEQEKDKAAADAKRAEEEKLQLVADTKKAEADKRKAEAELKKNEQARRKAEAEARKADEEKRKIEAAARRAEEDKEQAEAASRRHEESRRQAEANAESRRGPRKRAPSEISATANERSSRASPPEADGAEAGRHPVAAKAGDVKPEVADAAADDAPEATIVEDARRPVMRKARVVALAHGDDEASKRVAVLVEKALRVALAKDGRHEVIIPEPGLGSAQWREARAQIQAAEKSLQRGILSYEELELERAAKQFAEALASYEAAAAYLDESTGVARLSLWIAACQLLSGDAATGKKSLAAALSLDAGVQPPSGVFNPEMRATFGSVARANDDRPELITSFTSDPSGAEVYVDHRFVGLTPAKAPIPVGYHHIRISKSGFQSWGKLVSIEGKRPVKIRGTLAPQGEEQELARLVSQAKSTPMGRGLPESVQELGNLLQGEQVVIVKVRADAGSAELHVDRFDLIAAARAGSTDLKVSTASEAELAKDLEKVGRMQAGADERGKPGTSTPGVAVAEVGPTCQGFTCPRIRLGVLIGGGAAGVVMLATGIIFDRMAAGDNSRYRSEQMPVSDARSLAASGKRKAWVGTSLMSAGVLFASGSVAYYFLWPKPAASGVTGADTRLSVSMLPGKDRLVVLTELRY